MKKSASSTNRKFGLSRIIGLATVILITAVFISALPTITAQAANNSPFFGLADIFNWQTKDVFTPPSENISRPAFESKPMADDQSFAPAAGVTTNGGSGLAASYPDLASAITALNAATITSPVIITASGTEVAPAGGYSITAQGTSTNTIVIDGGNATTITAGIGTSTTTDAIFKLIGADYVTLQGFMLQESAGNTTATTQVEWGIALLYATATNGSQNNTIQNNTITLNRTNVNTFGIYANATHTATAPTTSATATGTAGGNTGLKVYGNSISNVNLGVVVIGPTAIADFNNGIDIGGTGGAQANSITNFGTNGTFSGYANVSGTVNGILVRNSINANISYNTITSSVGGVAAGTLNGIQVQAASNTPTATFTNTINNNNISLQSAVAAGAMNGITYPAGSASATSTLNINNNNFNTFGHTVAASGTIGFISTVSTNQFTTINNNTFTNISVNTTGSVTFISQSFTAPATGTKTVNGNSIVTGFTKTGAGGTVTFVIDNGSTVSGAVSNCQNNNFSNGTLTGATLITGISYTDGGTAPTRTVTGNTINNWTTGVATVNAMNFTYWNGTSSLSNNTVTNINGQSAINGITIGASANTATLATISSNTINNLVSSGAGGAVIGISCSNTSPAVNISSNTINTLSSTAAVAVSGISVSGATNTSVFKNKIYDLSGSNATSTVNGIVISAGTTVTASNNLIGDLRTPAANAANPLIGLNITGGTTINAFYNTVYLSGASTGALFGSSAVSVSTTPTVTLRNNIFANASSVTGAGLAAAHRRSGTILTTYASASNNNDFFGSTIFTDGTNTDSTITAYKTRVASRDSASFTENPPFLSTSGANANFLHISAATPTQLESGGTAVSGITDDFDGQTRNVTTPDVGADEFTGTPLDLTGPTISYTALGNTTMTTDRTLTITVIDPSGVPTAGAGLPVIYYRKNAGSYFSTQCSFVSGNTYNCSIPTAPLGGVVSGDVISYYVAAQDNANNVSVFPSAGASGLSANPPAVSTPPTAPSTYTIVAAFSGTKTVCASGCDYTTLTGASGIFSAINAGVVTSNVNVEISGDLIVGEDGSVALNAITEEPAGSNFTVKIYPTGAARTITSTTLPAGGFIRLNAADRVTIDGSIGGTGTDRSLTITEANTSATSAVVWLQSNGTDGATGNTIKNLNIVGQANTTTLIGIGTGATGTTSVSITSLGTNNNTNTIQNNNISKTQYGIYTSGASATTKNTGNVISQNLMNTVSPNNVQIGGIYVNFENNITISSNNIAHINTSATTPAFGISLGTRPSNTFTAFTGNEVTNATISANIVDDILRTGDGTAFGIGVAAVATGSGSNTLVNNAVSRVRSTAATPSDFPAGILLGGGTTSNTKVYFNSVSMTGVCSSSSPCFGVVVGGSNPVVDMRNNIFYNTQTSTTGKIYAIGLTYSTYTNLISNYNDYYTNSANFAVVGGLATTDRTFAQFKTDTGQDANSLSVDPLFASVSDLHLQPTSTLLGAGITIAGITIDFDTPPDTRDTPPEIGADEIPTVVAPGVLQFSSTTYTGNEGTTVATTVTRSMGTTGTVMVSYATSSSTGAVGGATCDGTTDYISASGTLTFGDTVASQPLNIQLCSDAVVDAGETVTVTLSAPTGGASLGANNPTTINITDVPPPLGGGSYNVGSGGDFASLTNAGGIFERINGSGATGNIIINITSDLSGELGTNALNEIAGGYTVVIRPSGGTARTISGTSSAALIKLNGADGVTIDGLNTGGNSLVISNTNTTGTVIWLASLGAGAGATNDTIRNLTITGGSTTGGSGICVGGATLCANGADNDNTTITGNTILKVFNGIAVAGTAAVSAGGDDTLIINNNIVGPATAGTDNIGGNGIIIGNTVSPGLSGNTVRNVVGTGTVSGIALNTGAVSGTVTQSTVTNVSTSSTTLAAYGIFVGSTATNSQVTQNTITNVSNSATGGGSGTATYGILVTATGSQILRNSISGIINAATAGYPARGIYVNTTVTASNVTVANNMVSNVVSYSDPSTAFSFQPVGIMIDGTTGGVNVYFNSVNLFGAHPGLSSATLQAAMFVGSSVTALDVRNNILSNSYDNSTSTTDKSYAIYSAAATSPFTTINNNDYFVSGTAGVLAFINGSDRTSLGAIQTATAQDANSISADPTFVSITDLHLQTGSPAINAGTAIAGITVDFDGQTRDATPDIGADEIVVATPTVMVSVTSLTDFGNVTVGSNSASQSYTVSGSNLTADIIVTAPSTDFQVSTDNSTFLNSVTVTQTGGTASALIYVRFSPQSAGVKSGNVTNASTGATMQNVAVSGTGVAANTPPTISAVGVTRQSGSPVSNSTIANVNDAESGANAVAVTVVGSTTVNGVTISNIVNSNGTVTANIVAACGASNADFTLQASDGSLTSMATLNVTVNANSAPTLTYNNASVAFGGSTTVNPATGPSDNGSVSSIVVQSQGTYTGTISVNNTTGVVSISNAMPAGTHTITIRATDQCGLNTDATFTLTVGAAPTVSLSVTSNSASEAAATVITVTATLSGGTSATNQTVTLGTSGTATLGSDYTLSGGNLSGTTLTIPMNMTSGSTTFTVIDDLVQESTETAILTISSPSSGITLGSPTSQSISITDNDVAPTFTSGNSTAFSVGTAGSFSVTTSGSPTPTTITSSGALPSGVNFTDNGNGTATLAGTPATGTAGMYPLTFTASNGVSPNATQNFTLTVTAQPAVSLSIAPATGSEAAATTFTATLTASAAVSGSQSVSFALTGGSASGADFGAIPTSITIANGQATGTATFTVFDDTLAEGTETATFTISSPSSGIALGSPTMASVTIIDNDDTSAPMINYTAVANTNSTANQVLAVSVTDNVGVPTTGSLVPRVYYLKDSQTTFTSTACVFVSGNYSYNCTIDYANVGGVVSGDTITYFVVAQDTSGNLASNPGGATGSDVNNLTTAPPAPNLYSIGAAASVPSGTYSNLEVGNSTLAGNVTVTQQLVLNGIVNNGSNTLTLGPNATITLTSGYIIGNVTKVFGLPLLFANDGEEVSTVVDAPNGNSSFVYPVGTANGYSPVTATVTSPYNGSSLSVFAKEGTQPNLNSATTLHRYWTLAKNGTLTADLQFSYNQPDVFGDESMYQVIRVEGGIPNFYTANTSGVNSTTNIITANGVSNFSDWTAGTSLVSPTAANSDISGRVINTHNRGLENVTVTLSGSLLTEPISVTTNNAGRYHFSEIPSGDTYILTVTSKRHTFAQPSQIFTVNSSMTNVNFVGEGW